MHELSHYLGLRHVIRDLQGFIQRIEAFLELLFGNHQRRDDYGFADWCTPVSYLECGGL
ncbi:MAG: hypothetical protein WCA79_11765 [Anaerolineales bacterium]